MNITESGALQKFRDGRFKEAADICSDILSLKPDNTDALFMLGLISVQTGNYDKAVEYFDKTLKINPTNISALYNLGNAYRDMGQIPEAFKCYQRVLQLDPEYTDAYINLGIIFRMQGRFEEETAFYQKALQLNPRSPQAFFNLGHAFFQKEEFEKALACYEKVIQLNPDSLQAYMNLGLVLRIKGYNERALASYRKAVQIDPDNAAAHWNLSNVLLLTGNYGEGWEEFEWFRKTEDCSKRQRFFPQPLWNGADIKGKTILLHAEEGFGDTLQFIRYAPLVVQRGANVIVESQKELTRLLRNMKGLIDVISHDEELPRFDTHCPMMSLPRVFGTTPDNIPSQVPYLHADTESADKWKLKLQNVDSRLKIGMVWSGGGLPFRKSCHLGLFSPLARLQDITLYSLQKGAPAKQSKDAPEGMRLLDYTDELHDFFDTAALIENLDLVIAVDTAVAHLAGAMGKPVWTLLPFVPDWRWLLDREDCPWYPTMRLFRQPALGDWKNVVRKISDSLQKQLLEKGKDFLKFGRPC